jgi:hypothetical protein
LKAEAGCSGFGPGEGGLALTARLGRFPWSGLRIFEVRATKSGGSRVDQRMLPAVSARTKWGD